MARTKKPAPFRVDRSKWRCGGNGKYALGKGGVALLNDEGFMCCIGQTCRQEGFADSALLGSGLPYDMLTSEWPEGLVQSLFGPKRQDYHTAYLQNSDLAREAAGINDTEDEKIPVKEARLRELFKKHGQRIVFFGKGVKRFRVSRVNGKKLLVA